MQNLAPNVKFVRLKGYTTASGVTTTTSDSIDRSRFDTVVFIASFASYTDGNYIHVEGSDDNSTFTDLKSTEQAAKAANGSATIITEVTQPLQQYLRVVASHVTALENIIALCYHSTYRPVPNNLPVNVHLSPLAVADAGVDTTYATKTDSYTVLATDNGTVFIMNATDKVFTLPATAAGLTYTFVTGSAAAAGGSTGTSISPQAADKIMGTGITAADDKDLINTAGTDAAGDMVVLEADGVDGWNVVYKVGTWAREA